MNRIIISRIILPYELTTMSWKEHLRDIADIQTDETPAPRLFEVIRYMLDKPIAIPKRILEDYIGESIEKAWDMVLAEVGIAPMTGKKSEFKDVQWVAHTDKNGVPYVAFATIAMGN